MRMDFRVFRTCSMRLKQRALNSVAVTVMLTACLVISALSIAESTVSVVAAIVLPAIAGGGGEWSVEAPALALPPERGRIDAEPGGGLLERRRLRHHRLDLTPLELLERERGRGARHDRSRGLGREHVIGKV